MWYPIHNITQIDSPALVIYPERITDNIQKVIRMAGGTEKLRPHVKTNKIAEVCGLMLDAGIRKFKCATIAEAEMLAMIGAPDVLLAYQPVGPKVIRFLQLKKSYPETSFSCLIDNTENARSISQLCKGKGVSLDIFIDLNVGMNRTGIQPEKTPALVKDILEMGNLTVRGLHGYDGHIHDPEIVQRQQAANVSFDIAHKVYEEIYSWFSYPIVMVMGGTPTFPTHIHRENCECSPGTFVFWDWGYAHMLTDMNFKYAALVITRVISIIDNTHICIDLGYKSVAAESPLPRIYFLNAPDAIPTAQSEEHLVLTVPEDNSYKIGDVLYGVPLHICPTVALYDRAYVIEKAQQTTYWPVVARNRYIKV